MFTMLGVFPLGLLLRNKRHGQIPFTTGRKWLSVGVFTVAGVFAIMASDSSMDGVTYLAIVCLLLGDFVIYVGILCHRLVSCGMQDTTGSPRPIIVYPEVPQYQNEDERLLAEQTPDIEIVPNPFFKDYGTMTLGVTDTVSAAEEESQSQSGSNNSTSEASSATISSDDSSTTTSPRVTSTTQPPSEVCQADATDAGPKSPSVSGWCLALSYLAIMALTASTSISISTLLSKYQLRRTTITEILFSPINLIPVLVITCAAGYRGVGTVVTNLPLNVLYLSLTFLFPVLPLLPQDEKIPRPTGMKVVQSVPVFIAGIVFMSTFWLEQRQRLMGWCLLSYGLVYLGINVYNYLGGGFADDS
jgi:hypothetical protein